MIQQLKPSPITMPSYVPSYTPQSVPSVTSVITASVPSVTSSVPSVTSLDPDTKMSTSEMNTLLKLRDLQDQIDELREEIRALKKPT
jgi:hypothetical protein